MLPQGDWLFFIIFSLVESKIRILIFLKHSLRLFNHTMKGGNEHVVVLCGGSPGLNKRARNYFSDIIIHRSWTQLTSALMDFNQPISICYRCIFLIAYINKRKIFQTTYILHPSRTGDFPEPISVFINSAWDRTG